MTTDRFSQPSDDIADLHVESLRNDLEGSKRHTLPPRFEAIKMHAVHASTLRELILSQTHALSESGDPLSDHDLNIVLQPIRLRAYAALRHPA